MKVSLMLQFLHITHLPHLSHTFLTQLQRFVGEDDPVTSLALEWITTVIKGCYYSSVAFPSGLLEGMDKMYFSLGVYQSRPGTLTDKELYLFDVVLDKAINDRLPLEVITVEDRRGCKAYDDSTTYIIKRYGLSLKKLVKIVERAERVTLHDVGKWYFYRGVDSTKLILR